MAHEASPNRLKVKATEQFQQTLILNQHIPSGSRKQTQKLNKTNFLPVICGQRHGCICLFVSSTTIFGDSHNYFVTDLEDWTVSPYLFDSYD